MTVLGVLCFLIIAIVLLVKKTNAKKMADQGRRFLEQALEYENNGDWDKAWKCRRLYMSTGKISKEEPYYMGLFCSRARQNGWTCDDEEAQPEYWVIQYAAKNKIHAQCVEEIARYGECIENGRWLQAGKAINSLRVLAQKGCEMAADYVGMVEATAINAAGDEKMICGVENGQKVARRGVPLKDRIRLWFKPKPFRKYDFTDFWDDSKYAFDTYTDETLTNKIIKQVESELGYKLPKSYIHLMKQRNGGIPRKNCFRVDVPNSWADDHIQIEGFHGIGKSKGFSLCGDYGSEYLIEEWEYPNIGIVICDTPTAGHTVVMLDYSACGPKGEPKVVFIDMEMEQTVIPLADNFEEFILGLTEEEEFDDGEDFYY